MEGEKVYRIPLVWVRRVIISIAACWIWLGPISTFSIWDKFLDDKWDLVAYQHTLGSLTCWALLGLILFSVRNVGSGGVQPQS